MTFVNRVDKELLKVIDYARLSRLGRPHDGGYVVPLDAIVTSTCMLSFGISQDWQFERDVQRINPDISIYAYDHSVDKKFFRKIARLAWATVLARAICFRFNDAKSSLDRWLNAIDYFRFFHGKVQHIQKRVWYNRDRGSAAITDIIRETGCGQNNKIFAKIDIEGSEYRILPYLIDEADKFSALAIEFHDVDICAGAFNEMIKSLSVHFYIVHIHGNNHSDLSVNHELPNTLELSFIHKKLFKGTPEIYKGSFPRKGLDTPNDPEAVDYPIILSEMRN